MNLFCFDTITIEPASEQKPKNVIILLHGYGGDGKDISVLANYWKRFFEKKYSYLVKSTFSQLLSITNCPKCDYSTHNHDPIQVITLPMKPHFKTIYDLLSDYTDLEVLDSDNMPHESNTRRECQEFIGEEWWFGFEQEYFFYQDGEPLGWKKFTDQGKNPDPQGQYYCAVGSANVAGREISERHLKACLQAGIKLTGTNAEVALGQWEYQCLGQGTRAADDLWISRYLLCEIAEEYGVDVVLHPKPKFGDPTINKSISCSSRATFRFVFGLSLLLLGICLMVYFQRNKKWKT